MKLFTVCKRW